MQQVLRGACAYARARLCEPSTWAGIAAICGALATQLPGQAKAFTIGAAVASAIVSVIRKERVS